MSGALQTLLAFIVVIGVLVVVHEFGHFWVARRCGVKILRFSVGFGRTLWVRKYGADGTEFALSAFPLGGYVKMLDEREAPVAASELHRAFNRQSLLKRSLIVVAGPLANFLLAIAAYWLVFMIGIQELRPILGAPVAGTPVAEAGFARGERVMAIDGLPVDTWQALRWELVSRVSEDGQGGEIRMQVINLHNEITDRVLRIPVAPAGGWGERMVEELGFTLYRPLIPPQIERVASGSAGARAGLQAGDRILMLDGEPVKEWAEVVTRVRRARGETLRIEIERAGERLVVEATPAVEEERGQKIGRLGIQADTRGVATVEMWTTVRHDPLAALGQALSETWSKSVFSLQMMGRMLTGDVSWKNISGPVTIADYAGQSAELGLAYFLQFMALVSISLGVLNLLPVPLLDGGHLMYYLYEAIRGAPPSEQAIDLGQRVGFALLIGLMVFAFYNDITRLISG